jgi:hypothetical protein
MRSSTSGLSRLWTPTKAGVMMAIIFNRWNIPINALTLSSALCNDTCLHNIENWRVMIDNVSDLEWNACWASVEPRVLEKAIDIFRACQRLWISNTTLESIQSVYPFICGVLTNKDGVVCRVVIRSGATHADINYLKEQIGLMNCQMIWENDSTHDYTGDTVTQEAIIVLST